MRVSGLWFLSGLFAGTLAAPAPTLLPITSSRETMEEAGELRSIEGLELMNSLPYQANGPSASHRYNGEHLPR